MAYISREELRQAMYHEAFETDTDLQKWDGGCWIRFKLFEKVIEHIPTADVVEKDAATIDGYPLRDLECIAAVMRDKSISPDEVIEVFKNARLIVNMVLEEVGKIMNETMECMQKLGELDE